MYDIPISHSSMTAYVHDLWPLCDAGELPLCGWVCHNHSLFCHITSPSNYFLGLLPRDVCTFLTRPKQNFPEQAVDWPLHHKSGPRVMRLNLDLQTKSTTCVSPSPADQTLISWGNSKQRGPNTNTNRGYKKRLSNRTLPPQQAGLFSTVRQLMPDHMSQVLFCSAGANPPSSGHCCFTLMKITGQR